MKKTVILLAILSALVLPAMAQGNGKIKHKKVDVSKKLKQAKDKSERQKHENGIWEGTKDNDGGGPKASKNQPAKVRAAFLRDYPGAGSVSWSKYRGDWTATFRNGPFWSTAVYHANGDRRDTRTQMPKEQVPVKILDIFKRRPETRLEDAVKIEVPKTITDIFRIKSILGGTAKFQFFDANGNEVQYNY